jgi:hypothetical protein
MVPERLGGLPRGTGGNIHPPREPLESVFPPAGGHGPWGQPKGGSYDRLQGGGRGKPSSVDPCSGGGNTATESKLVANVLVNFTSIFTNITSKFTGILGLDCM